jgi:hypothetical protein
MKKIMLVRLTIVGSIDKRLHVLALVCAEDTLKIDESLARCITETIREEIPLEIRYLVDFEVTKKRNAFDNVKYLRIGRSDESYVIMSCRLPDLKSVKDWEIALGRITGSDSGTPCYFNRLETGIYDFV